MEKMLTKVLCTAALLSSAAYAATATSTTPYLQGRSDTVRLGRVLAGTEKAINQYDRNEFYGQFSITGGGGQTFRSGRIASAFFGADLVGTDAVVSSCDSRCDNGGCLHFSGAAVADRAATDWLADYAGTALLTGSEDFESTVCFRPRLTKGFADFNGYFGLDNWMCGLWFSFHAPVVHIRSDLRVTETVEVAGTGEQTSVLPYFRGEVVLDTQEALAYGKWAECRLSKTRLSDIHLNLGYNFWSCEDYHAGIYLNVSAPAGNRPCGEYLFEPVVGNGKHWGLGGGFTGHISLWSCEENDSDFGFYLDAEVRHLFKARQTRTFDLVGRPNSRYAVAIPVVDGIATEPTAELRAVPVANLTAQDVDVKIDVEGDVAARFLYTYCSWGFELGYELWATSCEEFSNRKNCTAPRLATETFFLGDNTIYGPALVVAGSEVAPLTVADIARVGSKGLSHTVFGHIGYTWDNNDDNCWGWFVGVGGEAEFGSRNGSSCTTTATTVTTSSCSSRCDNDCARHTLSQWSVWAKAGVTF